MGRTVPVLFEKPGRHPGQVAGKSPYMQPVQVSADASLIGSVREVLVTAVGTNSLFGRLPGPDGTAQEQFLDEPGNDWFPHLSPDGKWKVYLAYKPEVVGHPGGQDVELRLLSFADKKVTVLARLFGGQGTINVPSWSPDSTRVAFVSYATLPQ